MFLGRVWTTESDHRIGGTSARLNTKLLVVVLALLAGCSSAGEWRRTPSVELEGRADSGVGCTDTGLTVWGGASVVRTVSEEPHRSEVTNRNDGARLTVGSDSWETLPPAQLSPRYGVTTVVLDGDFVVWGGGGAVVGSQDADDFEYPSDGAVFDSELGEWLQIPPSDLYPRTNGQGVPIKDGRIYIYGGTPPPGPHQGLPNAGFLDVDSRTIITAAAPPSGGAAFTYNGELMSVSRKGVFVYSHPTDTWGVRDSVPEDIGTVRLAVARRDADGVLVVAGDTAWTYTPGNGFHGVQGDLDSEGQIHAVTSGTATVVWDSVATRGWVLAGEAWERLKGPNFMGSRDGVAVCLASSTLILWGGIERRGFANVHRSDGAQLDLDP